MHQRRCRWHPVSTAPYNQNFFELRIVDGSEAAEEVLPFPCRHLNNGEWLDPDLPVRLQIKPIEWRVWQKERVTTSSCVEVADGASSLSFRLRSGSTPHAERWGRTAQQCVIGT